MAFDIVSAVEGDAAEVADVHLKAMGDNALLHAQFPSDESLAFLRGWLANDTVQHMKDDNKGVLLARGVESKEIASFVKWQVHKAQKASADQPTQAENWPEGCRTQYLEPYGELTERTRTQVMGDSPYYHVTFLCTKPNYAGQGAASSLLRKVQEVAAADGIAVVLESTMNAVTFYQRLHFSIAQGLSMILPKRGSDEPTDLYEEKCMVWRSGDSVGQKLQ